MFLQVQTIPIANFAGKNGLILRNVFNIFLGDQLKRKKVPLFLLSLNLQLILSIEIKIEYSLSSRVIINRFENETSQEYLTKPSKLDRSVGTFYTLNCKPICQEIIGRDFNTTIFLWIDTLFIVPKSTKLT